MTDPVASMLAALDLANSDARTDEDIFTGVNEPTPHGRIFGGQVLGQSIVAASRTLDSDRRIHSMHGYFLRPGIVDLPTTFSVDRIYDGGSFSTRRVQAYQDGRPIFSMIGSFQAPEEGLDHQIDMPADIPQPEDVPSSIVEEIEHPLKSWQRFRAFELRHVVSPVFFSIEGELVPHQVVWLKARSPMPDGELLHTAALAYASDFSVLDAAFRVHGVPRATPGIKQASLDHAMWFHRSGRVDDWLCYVQDSPSTTGGRGLSLARLYTRDGVLLATVAQEGLMRLPRPTP